MSLYQVASIWSPVADAELFSTFRPTIGMLLIADEGRSIVLVEPEKAQAGCFIPPQGGIEEGESLCSALQREVYEELPGVQVIFDSAQYLFAAVNEIPVERYDNSESPKNKLMFWVAATVNAVPKDVCSPEVRQVMRVASRAHLEAVLSTGLVRPHKKQMILEAVGHARRLGMLADSFAVSKMVA